MLLRDWIMIGDIIHTLAVGLEAGSLDNKRNIG